MRSHFAHVVVVVAVLCASASGCVHSTEVTSDRAGAQVFVDDQPEPVGTTPVRVAATRKPIHVVSGDERLTFTLETEADPIAVCVNVAIASVVAGGIIAGTGAALYAIGLVLSWAAPAVGPVVALIGGPPAFIGTAFWTVVGGGLCGALMLPFAACGTGQRGPESVHVNFDEGTVRATGGAVKGARLDDDDGLGVAGERVGMRY